MKKTTRMDYRRKVFAELLLSAQRCCCDGRHRRNMDNTRMCLLSVLVTNVYLDLRSRSKTYNFDHNTYIYIHTHTSLRTATTSTTTSMRMRCCSKKGIESNGTCGKSFCFTHLYIVLESKIVELTRYTNLQT